MTAGKPLALKNTAKSNTIAANLSDLAYFNVEVVDENGILVPNAVVPVKFEVQGNIRLQAVANGNPIDMKSFQQQHINTNRGMCQLIVRSFGSKEEIAINATSEKLKPTSARTQVVQM